MPDASLDIQIKGNSTGFGRVAAETTKQINGIKDAVKGIPLEAIRGLGSSLIAFASVGFISQQVAGVIDYAGKISDLSARVGVTTEFLQAADYAAKQFGANLEDVVVAVRELKRSSANAIANPRGADAKAFEQLGISMERLKSMSAEQLFREVATALEKSALSGAKLNDVINLLGRSASSLVPMLRGGFQGLEEDAKRLGLVIEKSVIDQLDESGDRWDRMKLRSRAQFAPFVAKGLDVIEGGQKIGKSILEFLGAITNFEANSQRPDKIFGAIREGWSKAMDVWAEKGVGNDGPINGPELPPGWDTPAATRKKASGDSGGLAGSSDIDALQRLGLFINGSSSLASIANKQLTVAERALEANREMVRELRTKL